MKKLIVFGFAAIVAVAANAAAIQWSATNIAKTGDSSAGLTAYLVDATKVSRADMITALSGGDFSNMTAANYLLTTTTIAQGTTGMGRINVTDGTATAGNKYSAYTVILDGAVGSANNYFITAEISNKEAPELGNLQFAFASQAGVTWNTISGSTPPVPEPTSGLLMLVGLGALALRRRKA